MKETIYDTLYQILDTCEHAPIFNRGEKKLPQSNRVIDFIRELQKVIFPGYFAAGTDVYFLGNTLNGIREILQEQLEMAFGDSKKAEEVCEAFISKIPEIQRMLVKDVEAEFDGDPAAQSREEIIFCYPGLYAIFVYRAAHELYRMKVPMIPRIMTEYAHSKTGIDINAGATIGEYFFIDHGTGIVIGETTQIGSHVKLYQGVTLGALSTRSGQLLAGKKRHPTIEDNVTIYANATILGGNTVIGANATIGGNTFITESVAPDAKIAAREGVSQHHRGEASRS